jgi:hypothetical protein
MRNFYRSVLISASLFGLLPVAHAQLRVGATGTPSSTLDVVGSIGASYRQVTTNTYTLTTTDFYVSYNGTVAGTFTLPTGTTAKGRLYTIRNASATKPLTVQAAGSETLDGQTNFVVAPTQSVQIMATGTAGASFEVVSYSAASTGMFRRLTTAQRDAIESPVIGATHYNTTFNCLESWTGTVWRNYCGGATASYTGSTLNCSGTLAGIYQAGRAAANTNTKQFSIGVVNPGDWTASTNTVNGVSFVGTGNFGSTGTNTGTLTATGTPVAPGSFSYTLSVGGQTCTFSVNFITTTTYACSGGVLAITPSGPSLTNGTSYAGTYTLPYNTGSEATYDVTTVSADGLTLTRVPGSYATNGGNVVYNLSGTYTGDTGTQTSFNVPEGCTISTGPTFNYAGGVFRLSGGTGGAVLVNGRTAGGTYTLPYTAGNGATYGSATVTSNGLTLTRTAGTYSLNGGNVVYQISGTYSGINGAQVTFPILPEAATAVSPSFTSCKALLAAQSGIPTGVYQVDPDGTATGSAAPFNCHCDQTTNGGGWTLVAVHATNTAPYNEPAIDPVLPGSGSGKTSQIWAYDNSSFNFTQVRFTNVSRSKYAITTAYNFQTLLAMNTGTGSYSSLAYYHGAYFSVAETNLANSAGAYFNWRGKSADVAEFSDTADWGYMVFNSGTQANTNDAWDREGRYWVLNGRDNSVDPATNPGATVLTDDTLAGQHWNTTSTTSTTTTQVWLR